MRVAAISDIHGNLPALEAVLAEIDAEGVDEIVVAGDTAHGPWPAEVVDLLVHPQLAKGDEIIAIPTLVRKLPQPIRKVIGDMSNEDRTLVGLQLRPSA